MGKVIDIRSIPRPVDWRSSQEKIALRNKELLEKKAELDKRVKELLRKNKSLGNQIIE